MFATGPIGGGCEFLLARWSSAGSPGCAIEDRAVSPDLTENASVSSDDAVVPEEGGEGELLPRGLLPRRLDAGAFDPFRLAATLEESSVGLPLPLPLLLGMGLEERSRYRT